MFTGSDTMLLASLAMGGAGTICGAANVAPSWVVRIYDNFRRGDWNSARTDLQLQGICEPWPAPPTAALDDAATARLRECLDRWGLLSKPRD
jgi:dihydrodipicolinate synthase/N-acetylneuraminate lyase